MNLSGAQAVVRMLQAYRVRYLFGLPGDTSIPLYEALREARGSITHVLVRDERSAAFMADAYARLSWAPGVCEAPSGAGALYLLPGIAEANRSSIPVIALTTDIPAALEGRNMLTELDQAALFASVTKWRVTLRRAGKAPEVMRTAFRMATSGRPGAVQISLPEDVLQDPFEEGNLYGEAGHEMFPACRAAPDPASIEEAADQLLHAARPVIVCGGGLLISGAWRELTSLAEMLGAPVGTSIHGKGSIDEAHPLSLGVVGGNGARPYANQLLSEADLVLFVGCKTDSVTTLKWTLPASDGRVPIVHVDLDPSEIGRSYRTAVGIAADARLALAALCSALGERLQASGEADRRAPWVDAEGFRRTWWEAQSGKFQSSARPIKPQQVFRILSELLPRESVIIADAGTPTPFTSAYYLSPAGRHVVIPRAFGGLGYAIPAVVGAKLARPEAPVIGLMGDGSFAMSAGELETIARLDLPVTLLQFNNGSYGWIKALQHFHQAQHYFSVDFSQDTDYAAVARGFGLNSVRVEHPGELESVMQQALRADRPSFIDVVTEPEVSEVPPVHKWLTEASVSQRVTEPA